MNTTVMLVALSAALLAGCGSEPGNAVMPEVNDTNCQIEAVKKIEDKKTRETFAGLCSRRSPAGGGIAPTKKPMNWLELADPKHQQGQEAKP